MKLEGKVVVVTGAGAGIGRALVRRFAADQPKAIVIADRDPAAAAEVAREVGGGLAISCDVGREADLQALVKQTVEAFGGIDLFCSNAGIGSGKGVEATDAEWQRLWDVNLMSHVWAMRALLPHVTAPRSGTLLITASAAGLLSMIGDAPYTVTKHAAVALAEWLAITYGDKGLTVCCLCPQFVNTDLLKGALALAGGGTIQKSGPVLEPEQVAEAVVGGLEAERFLILPHPEVAGFVQKKVSDPDRWLGAMRKLKVAGGKG